MLAEAAAAWTPERAAEQRRRARRELDWRLRLQRLCTAMGWPLPPTLDAELAALG